METTDNSPVLLFKRQGEVNDEFPELKDSDFFLAIMNSAQCEMLKQYGRDCVCMDSTHGVNAYDFELTTLLVLDDIREGFPAAFLLSSRTDQEVCSVFLKIIQEHTGKLTCNTFMSDIAESFHNAWTEVMGPAVHRLYCSWHVDRAWRKNLTKVTSRDKQIKTYKLIRTLLQENDVKAFSIMLEEGLKQLCEDEETVRFGNYFKDYYSTCSQSWAYCFRQHVGINTNMHLERMHRTLKYIYLEGKTVKRLDKAIYAIMKFVRDKCVERLIVLHKGKITNKLSSLRNRHKKSLSLKRETVTADTEGGSWFVQSNSVLGEVYYVKKLKENCTCKLRCDECKACLHSFTCSCPDSSVKWNMCKHIHLVCQSVQCSEAFIEEETGEIEDDRRLFIDKEQENTEILAHIQELSKVDKSDLEKDKHALKCQVQEVLAEIDNCTSASQLQVISRFIAPIKPTLIALSHDLNIIKPLDAISYTKKMNINANKSIDKQRMYSTKKKFSKKSQVCKSSASECQNIAAALVIQNQQRLEK